MTEQTAKVCHYKDVPALVFGDEAPGVTIRWVIDEDKDGAPHYALRVIEVQPGGHTPEHAHPFEHENFVLEGEGRVLLDTQWQDVGPGSVVFVPANMRHTYVNKGEGVFRFLCGVPVSRLTDES